MKKLVQMATLALVLALNPVLHAGAADVPAQMGHKALYKMSLASTKNSAVIDINGQMYYSFTDTCDAWSTDQKFDLNYIHADDADTKTNTQFTSRELKSGAGYDFAVKSSNNGQLEKEYVGSAARNADGTATATYSKPEQKEAALPKGVLFPTQHTIQMLTTAMKGGHIFNAEMFDGSDGEGALEVNVIVGDVIKPDDAGKLGDNPLLKSPAHRVRLAFYPPDNPDKPNLASEPDYEMTMIMHENGVVSSLQIDYDQFSVKGELQAIEAAPSPKC